MVVRCAETAFLTIFPFLSMRNIFVKSAETAFLRHFVENRPPKKCRFGTFYDSGDDRVDSIIPSDIDINNPIYNTYQIFKQIVELYERRNNVNIIMSESENRTWDHIEYFWVHVDSNEVHLPVIVFDYIKPSIPTRFILHVLLSQL